MTAAGIPPADRAVRRRRVPNVTYAAENEALSHSASKPAFTAAFEPLPNLRVNDGASEQHNSIPQQTFRFNMISGYRQSPAWYSCIMLLIFRPYSYLPIILPSSDHLDWNFARLLSASGKFLISAQMVRLFLRTRQRRKIYLPFFFFFLPTVTKSC